MPSRPWSRTRRASSSSDSPPCWLATFMTIGRLTPVTTSTSPSFRNIDAMFVGVPPNMSVIISTPAPSETRSIARRTSFFAASTSSCQPMETAVMWRTWPMIVSAADTNSFATCPCETMTPATRRAPSPFSFSGIRPPPPLSLAHVAVYGGGVVAGAAQVSRDGVGDHHGAVAAARAADADGDVGLALALVERQEVVDQLREAAHGLANLVALVEEADDARVVAREVSEFGHEVRVG